MKFLQKYIILAVLLKVALCTNAQDKKVVQVSGYIIAEGTEIAVPYVSIRNESYGNETFAANHEGFFSFVAHVGDEIVFSSIGYRSVRISIPNVDSDKFTTRIEMMPTIEELPVVTVGPPLPWASIEEFNMEFLALNIGGDDVMTAKRNLSPQALASLSKIVPRSAEEIQTFNTFQRHINMSNKAINQNMANPLLNPFAWGQLINQIKRGDFSRERLKY
ncbi:carboxypeptidase-like regulatory domain-containing protein [Sphingobacterium daejeonense]|uniref:carboxypeptidase-like regulatory domain-containing protein n=1 Tax=Sphingobacterium daejeonense TaxID=371142 RepID=UPI0021A7CF24|nr:carboxypeptidase-like regulatory domain-containing protein [Sphingobacterium daejeonense]MCT1532434.1 carboxypeptidase-like regulatory domain-containing protein [Sphingobacterium daejeonense]